ncbi:TPA: hypothetical protein OHR14_003414 [Escherichia coli]|nr:hypothetical protein [Escherichia coli]
MQHVPEGVIQAPESPDAPEALPGCRSISDDDLCAWCTRLLYRPGEISLCRLSTGNGILWGSDQFWAEFVQPGRTCKPCVARGVVI